MIIHLARMLCERLRSSDLQIIAYDPYLTEREANSLGIDLVSIEGVFSRSDVVSIHTPALAETHGMIDKPLLRLMKPGATLINTSRGAVINEHDLITVAAQRTDLQIILDVTDPEPPIPGSLPYSLSNVVLTTHIAGSMDSECRRMARYMIEELIRYNKAEPLRWVVTPELARISSHRPNFMTAQLVP
jgi:phosphoglycerate dehydrogenase-like enzyme